MNKIDPEFATDIITDNDGNQFVYINGEYIPYKPGGI